MAAKRWKKVRRETADDGLFARSPSETRLTDEEKKYLTERTDTRPNLLTVKIMLSAIIVVCINWIMNELGAYRVGNTQMRIGSIAAIAVLVFAVLYALSGSRRSAPSTKYVLMLCAIAAIFIVATLMSFHTTLCLVLPMLLATLYKSQATAIFSLVGSLAITFLSPIFGYLTDTWDTLFLQVLLQLCGYDSQPALERMFTTEQSVGQITLYLSMPRSLIVITVGIVAVAIARSSRAALDDRMHLMQNTNRLISMQSDMLDGLATIIESRDGSTGVHVITTKSYVAMMTAYMLKMNLYPETVTQSYADMVIKAAVLHDIGKIAVPDNILNKPGKFTAEEYEVMKKHPVSGDRMVRRTFGSRTDIGFSTIVHDVVYYHHEKYDGSGYPDGLAGEAIPFSARIMAIADAFDAMTAKRVYKTAIPASEAIERLKKDAGTHFDPGLVAVFIAAYTEETET